MVMLIQLVYGNNENYYTYMNKNCLEIIRAFITLRLKTIRKEWTTI